MLPYFYNQSDKNQHCKMLNSLMALTHIEMNVIHLIISSNDRIKIGDNIMSPKLSNITGL